MRITQLTLSACEATGRRSDYAELLAASAWPGALRGPRRWLAGHPVPCSSRCFCWRASLRVAGVQALRRPGYRHGAREALLLTVHAARLADRRGDGAVPAAGAGIRRGPATAKVNPDAGSASGWPAPRSGPPATGDGDRPTGRREQVQHDRHPPVAHERRVLPTERLLHLDRQQRRIRVGVVDA